MVAPLSSAAPMMRRRDRRETLARSVPPAQKAASKSGLQNCCRIYLAPTLSEIFAEICWCLSDRDAVHVVAASKVLKSKLADAGKHLRYRSELLLHDSLGTSGLWCSLPFQEAAAYLRAISPLSVATASNVSIHQCSRCPPLFARRVHSSLDSLRHSSGESTDPMVLSLVSFRFRRADIEACLHMQAEPQASHFSLTLVNLPSCNLELRMTLEVSDLQEMELGACASGGPRVKLNLHLDRGRRSHWPLARDRGEYAIMARALPHIGTERQVDIRGTVSFAANGAQFSSSRPYKVSENCWTYHALRHGNPLIFFVAISRAEPVSDLEHFEDLFS